MGKPSSGILKSLEMRAAKYHASLFAPEGAEALQYLTEERGLQEETLKRFALGAVTVENADQADGDKVDYISIPYKSAYGITTGIRFRNLPGRFGPKYSAPPKQESGIYNVAEVTKGHDWMIITEGELDALTLIQMGLPAVGIPGANGFKQHYYTIFEGAERVIIIGDNDGSGDKQEPGKPPTGSAQFIKKVSEAIENPVVIMCPEGYDINGLYKEKGEAAVKELLRVKD